MRQIALMQQVLGEQWAQLPPALQAHYTQSTNTDVGLLDIEYPRFMQIYLNLVFIFGALINRRGKGIPTSVEKWMAGETQHWKRAIRFPDGQTVLFQSRWQAVGANRLVEYINPFIGLRMAVHVDAGKLYYRGECIVLKLGALQIPIPECLILGHTTIVESAISESRFVMDFKLTHPLFGQIYRYTGEFHTEIA